MALQRLLECLDAEGGVERVRQPPGEHSSARPVHDRHEIAEAPRDRQIRDVGAPHLAGGGDVRVSQKVGVDLLYRVMTPPSQELKSPEYPVRFKGICLFWATCFSRNNRWIGGSRCELASVLRIGTPMRILAHGHALHLF